MNHLIFQENLGGMRPLSVQLMFCFGALNQTHIVFPDVSYCKFTPVSHPTHSF